MGPVASRDVLLGADCVRHARLFFDRPDYDLKSASIGAFALMPTTAMRSALLRDYQAMSGMIFGRAPAFDDILDALRDFEQTLVASAVAWPRPAAR